MVPKIQAVDLFCGAGGLTRGLLDAGITVKAGVDLNKECEFAYTYNNEGTVFINKSVTDLSENDINKHFSSGGLKLLCGCAPCQTFSTMNRRNKETRKKDSRWTLLLEFRRLLLETLPDLVSMENVPGLLSTDVFQEFTEALSIAGYYYDYKVLDCSKYGMPQKRNRLVLVASRLGEISIPAAEELCLPDASVRSCIGNLPRITAGETFCDDPLHTASSLSEANLNRIKASKPGGSWRDWNKELLLACHERKRGKGYGAVYGRMEWEKPSPTITTQFYNYGSGRFGHPEQDRALSLREGALLQGFPASYKFYDSKHPIGKRSLGVMIGNAVPVGLARIIGDIFVSHVNKHSLLNMAAGTSHSVIR